MQLLDKPHGFVPPGSLPSLEAFMNGYLNGMAILDSPLRDRGEELDFWNRFRNHVHAGTSFCGSVYQCFFRSGYDDDEAWQNMRCDFRKFVSNEPLILAASGEKNLSFNRKCFNDVMRGLLEQPHMYLGTYSLSLLVQFLNGLMYAVKLHCQAQSIEEHFLNFEDWLQLSDTAPAKMRWDRLLAIKAGYNDISALEKFCEYYKAFLIEAANGTRDGARLS